MSGDKIGESKLCIDTGDYDEEEEYKSEDRKRTISIDDGFMLPGHKEAPTSPLLRGMDLDLSFAMAEAMSKDGKANSELKGEEGVQEESILVIFDLPDGSQGESQFKLGQTVEFLKSYVESEYGIPMMEQVMYLEDKVMLNPFSLLDFPEAKGVDEMFVRVEGPLPSESKK